MSLNLVEQLRKIASRGRMDDADVQVVFDAADQIEHGLPRYPEETLDEDDDDGTMPNNVDTLRQAVVGHKIVKAERETWVADQWGYESSEKGFVITLDNGTQVRLANTNDCCAYTDLDEFLLHPDKVDHVIMGVGTTDGYTTWHIYADMGDVLELTVGWSCGNPFYYGYGFDIQVVEVDAG